MDHAVDRPSSRPSHPPDLPVQRIWQAVREVLHGHEHLRRLQSDAVALQVLKSAHPDAAVGALYGNAAKVSTNARQAILYEHSAAGVDIAIRPLILYYSYLHWMKTLLYTSDLAYPRGSSLLQHGMSVRKVKREVYRWPLDYAYIYKEGVLQSFRDTVAPNLTLPNKIPVGHLLGSIPTVCEAIAQFYPEFQHVYALHPASPTKAGLGQGAALMRDASEAQGTKVCQWVDRPVREGGPADANRVSPVDDAWYVPRRIASNIGLTPIEWLDAYAVAGERSTGGYAQAEYNRRPVHETGRERGDPHGRSLTRNHHRDPETDDPVLERDPAGFLHLPSLDTAHPWLHAAHGTLWIGDGSAYPLWISHLITVYVLSTLCRYNAVEWLDIIHWNNDKDAHLVREYLEGVPTFPELMGSIR